MRDARESSAGIAAACLAAIALILLIAALVQA